MMWLGKLWCCWNVVEVMLSRWRTVKECDLNRNLRQHWISCFYKKSHVPWVKTLFQVLNTDFSATPRFIYYNRYQPVGPVKVARTSLGAACQARHAESGVRSTRGAEQVGLPLRYPCSLKFRIPCPQLISAHQFRPHGIKSCGFIQWNQRPITVSNSRLTRRSLRSLAIPII